MLAERPFPCESTLTPLKILQLEEIHTDQNIKIQASILDHLNTSVPFNGVRELHYRLENRSQDRELAGKFSIQLSDLALLLEIGCNVQDLGFDHLSFPHLEEQLAVSILEVLEELNL